MQGLSRVREGVLVAEIDLNLNRQTRDFWGFRVSVSLSQWRTFLEINESRRQMFHMNNFVLSLFLSRICFPYSDDSTLRYVRRYPELGVTAAF